MQALSRSVGGLRLVGPAQPSRPRRVVVAPSATAMPVHPEVARWWGPKKEGHHELRGKRPPPTPELRDAVLPLATVCGADLTATTRAIACLSPGMQQGVLNFGAEVASYLRDLGVEQSLLARLLRRCLPLFSMPVDKRAGALMGQLLGLGLTASEAARCFEAAPMAGAVKHGFQRPIQALAHLLEAGSMSEGLDGRRLLADLLIAQPQAASLLALHGGTLQAHAEYLQGLGLSIQELVAAVHKDALLLTMDPEELAEQEAVLREELGADRDVFASMLLFQPTAVVDGCSHDLQRRVTRLVEEFGQEGALSSVLDMPTLLTVDDAWATFE